MRWIRKIAIALGIRHDEQQAIELPTKDRPKQQPKAELPDDVVATKTGLQKRKFEADGATWEPVRDAKQARAKHELTERDLAGISERGLDVVKAAHLKQLWASGASCGDVEKAMKGQRGYSKRTIADYWSVFNAK